MDANASNYDASATAQAYDQWGNLQCIYASCDDVPEYGCNYADGFGPFNADFGADDCVTYGGTPCEESTSDIVGCMDANASNYDASATAQAYDLYGNLECIYASCDDVPEYGCIYANGFGAFNADFGADDCISYGGTPCQSESNNPSEQQLNLVDGWSIFSTYMIPADMDIASILAPIVDELVIAKDYLGAAYLPEWSFNGIGDIQIGQAYQIKTASDVDLTIGGAYALPEENLIELEAGWGMIGYLRAEPAPIDLVLADLVDQDNLIIAKDYLGAAYLPEWNFNGIGDILPGAGYQIKTNTAGTLQYLSNDESYRLSSLEVTENNVSHFSKVVPTDNNMTVVIEDAAWDVLPTEGSEVAAFDKAGNLIGSAIYSSPVTVVTVWGDDAMTSEKEGSLVSEAVSFKVFTSGDVRDFTVTEWAEGSSTYLVDAINVASSIEINTLVADANSSDRVLVKVINVLGQEVELNDESFKGEVLFNVYDDGSVEQFVK